MNLSRLNVIWSKCLHATKQWTFIEVHRFFEFSFWHQKAGHQPIYRHMERMTGSQMMLQAFRRQFKEPFTLLKIVYAPVGSNQNTKKSNPLSVHGHYFCESLLTIFDGELKLILFQGHFRDISQSYQINFARKGKMHLLFHSGTI